MIRLLAQVALTGWAAAEAMKQILTRGRDTPTEGTRFAVAGLLCFGVWMFMSALSIKAVALFPREDTVWAFALLEAVTAIAAWSHLIVNLRHTFRLTHWRRHAEDGADGSEQ